MIWDKCLTEQCVIKSLMHKKEVFDEHMAPPFCQNWPYKCSLLQILVCPLTEQHGHMADVLQTHATRARTELSGSEPLASETAASKYLIWRR